MSESKGPAPEGGGASVEFRDADERSAWDGYAAGVKPYGQGGWWSSADSAKHADALLLERRKREGTLRAESERFERTLSNLGRENVSGRKVIGYTPEGKPIYGAL